VSRTRSMLQFAVGLAIAITAALMTFCQEHCFLGLDMESWPAVLGIFGIGVIATSIVALEKASCWLRCCKY
jgi:riboflavin transporter FmnP